MFSRDDDKAQSLHYVVMLAARRNAARTWMRVARKEVFFAKDCTAAENAMYARVEAARANERERRDLLARSAQWQVSTSVYRGGKHIATTHVEGQGRFRLLELGIPKQRA